VDKKGYVQKELKEALDIFQEYPEKAIYLIPARLDDCKVPHTDGKRGILTKYHIKWTTIKGRQQSKRCYKVLIGRLQLGYMLC
jgi:hypothetical protein